MDDLRTYVKGLDDEPARVRFATACGTTLGHLRNVMGGHSSCSPALARTIERQTDGLVKRWTLRPTDWWLIWPELVDEAQRAGIEVPAGQGDAQPEAA